METITIKKSFDKNLKIINTKSFNFDVLGFYTNNKNEYINKFCHCLSKKDFPL